MSEICCMQLAGNTGRKNSPSAHHRTTLSDYIFVSKACIDNRKKNRHTAICPPHVLTISSQDCKLRPINRWDRLVSLEQPIKFQRVSRLGFVTAATSLLPVILVYAVTCFRSRTRNIILSSCDLELWPDLGTWPREVQDEPACQNPRSKII